MTQHLRRAAHRLLWVLLGLLFVAFGLRAVTQAAVFPSDLTDFTVYFNAARTLASGHDPYSIVTSRGWHFTSPLAAAVLFVPLTQLPTAVAASLWYLLGACCLAGTIVLAIRGLFPLRDQIARHVWLAPMVTLGGPIVVTLCRGQWFLLIGLLITLGWWFSVHDREFLSGICFGAAAALKLVPMIFLLYLLSQRRRAALSGFLLSVAVLAFALPGMFVKWDRIPTFYEKWGSVVVMPALTGARTEVYAELLSPALKRDQSVEAVMARTAGSKAAAQVVDALLLIAGALVLLGNRSNRSASMEAARVGAVTCLMLFVSPVTWSHYYVVLLLPLVLLSSRARSPLGSDWTGRLFIAMIGLSMLNESFSVLQIAGALLLNGLIIFFACCLSLRHPVEERAVVQCANAYAGSDGRFPSIVTTATESSCHPLDGRKPIASASAATR